MIEKKISSLEFDEALKLIAAYKFQLDNDLTDNFFIEGAIINIQNEINKKTFNGLQNYYQLYYNIDLEWDDLARMDASLLQSIDYDKMALGKGFGCVSLFNFKDLMVYHGVLKAEDLNTLKKRY